MAVAVEELIKRPTRSLFGTASVWFWALAVAIISIIPMTPTVTLPNGAFNPFDDWGFTNRTPHLMVMQAAYLTAVGVLCAAIVLTYWAVAALMSQPTRPQAPSAGRRLPSALMRFSVRTGWSPQLLAVLAFFTAWNIASLVVPMVYTKGTDPYWLDYAAQAGKDTNLSYGWKVFYNIGGQAGYPAYGCFFLTFLPVSRTSPLLGVLGLSSDEANWFHRLSARMLVFWTSVHGIFTSIPALIVSPEVFLWIFWEPTSAGIWNFAGNIAWIVMLLITATSFSVVRRRAYNFFRLAHYLFWLILPFGALHMASMFFYAQVGLIIYSADLAHRWVLKSYATNSGARTIGGEDGDQGDAFVVLRPQGKCVPRLSIGDTVYVRVPRVSWVEWHPFDVTALPGSLEETGICAKVSGDWTRRLFAEVRSLEAQVGQEKMMESSDRWATIAIDLEGPYGRNAALESLQGVFAPPAGGGGIAAAKPQVLLVAAGTGVTALSSTLRSAVSYARQLVTAGGSAAQQPLRNLTLVWVNRSPALLRDFTPLLESTARLGARVVVHNTSPAGKEPMELMPTDRPTGGPAGGLSMEGQGELGAPQLARGRGGTVLPLLVTGLMVWLAAAGSIGGYIAGTAMTGMEMGITLSEEQAIQYNATVAANYKAATGQPLAPGTWPDGQTTAADVSAMSCSLVGQPTGTYIFCYNYAPLAWQYGQPYPCENVGLCEWSYYMMPTIMSSVVGVAVPLLAALLFRFLFRRQMADFGSGSAMSELPEPASPSSAGDGSPRSDDAVPLPQSKSGDRVDSPPAVPVVADAPAGATEKAEKPPELAAAAPTAGGGMEVYAGRPSWPALTQDVCREVGPAGVQAYVCASQRVTRAVRSALAEVTAKGPVRVTALSFAI